jgi:chemotaxis protein methyltransferase CheR
MSTLKQHVQEVLGDGDYASLKRHVMEATGLAYYRNLDEEFAGHIVQRLAALNLTGCADYLARLVDPQLGEPELDILAQGLTIGETFFYRHRELFDALRSQVIPERIAHNRQQRQLRIWSAGCAIGAECYSLAILLRREFAEELAGWDVAVIGTDINRHFLAQAQRGEYGGWSFRSAPAQLRETCFTPRGANWVVNDEFRRGVSFQYHNLVQHPFPSLVNNLSAFDLILCRNVMIYFDAAIVQRLVGQFHECLADGGWFVVGHSEPNVELFRGFETVNAPGAVLYRKLSASAAPQREWTPPELPELPEITRPVVMPPTESLAFAPLPQPASVEAASAEIATAIAAPNQTSPAPNQTLATIRELLDRGECAAASELCCEQLATGQLNPRLQFYFALVKEQLGEHEESARALRRAIYLDRNFVLAHYYLGLLSQKCRQSSAAARSFRNVLKLVEARPDEEPLADADGLTIAALRQLAQMQLEVVEGS